MTSDRHILLATLLQLGSTQREIGLWIEHTKNTHLSAQEISETLSHLPIAPTRKQKLQSALGSYEKACDSVRNMIDRGGDIVLVEDSDFPHGLRLAKHLNILWIRGNRSLLAHPMMSIVGTRDASNYSKKALTEIIPPLVRSGWVIVSGGAKGCDRLAHEITIESGGQTVAVFGTGVDRSYPSEHRSLFEQILSEGGLLISQFALGTPPEPHQFPMRNEIVALLGDGLLVSEAQEGSGSLITARLALEYNKEVFALPGSLYDPLSRGSNLLIQKSEAKLVLSADDILAEIGGHHGASGTTKDPAIPTITEQSDTKVLADMTGEMQSVYGAIDRHAGKSIDTIAADTGLSTLTVCDALAELEIEGYITLSSRGYVRS